MSEIRRDLLTFSVSDTGLRVGVFRIEDVTVRPSTPEFEAFEQTLFEEIRRETDLDDIKNDPVFRSYRDLYWNHGLDPTKVRVSSEALVRRIVAGQNLWRVNNVVDSANLASATLRVPIGLIDEQKIDGGLCVRTARPGETFTRIGGESIACRGRELVLADDAKIVCYGFASYDSDGTKVTTDTSSVLVVLYGAPVVSAPMMTALLSRTIEMMSRYIPGRFSGPMQFENQQ